MHYWDVQAEVHGFHRIVAGLRPADRLSFGLLCVIRVGRNLATSYGGTYSEQEKAYTAEVTRLASDIWSARNDQERLAVLRQFAFDRVDAVEASRRELFGQYELFYSLVHLLEAWACEGNAESVLDAAFQAYYALCQWHVLGPETRFRGGTTADMAMYEATTPACVAEVAAQLATLGHLERVGSGEDLHALADTIATAPSAIRPIN